MKQIYKRILQFILINLILWCSSNSVPAFESKEVHPEINKNAAIQSCLASDSDNYLVKELGISKGLDALFNNKSITYWIKKGGTVEDAYFRPLRHFHDPLKESWDIAGFVVY